MTPACFHVCSPAEVRSEGDASDGLSCPETITRTYRATDACGNFADCTQIITVNDTENPVVTCPGDMDVNVLVGETSAIVNFVSSVNDNCAGASVTCNPPSGSSFPLGPTTVTCTGEDVCGNTDQCSFVVTVHEVVSNPPVANDDQKYARSGATLLVVAPGVLGNDSDLDGDALSAVLNTGVAIVS